MLQKKNIVGAQGLSARSRPSTALRTFARASRPARQPRLGVCAFKDWFTGLVQQREPQPKQQHLEEQLPVPSPLSPNTVVAATPAKSTPPKRDFLEARQVSLFQLFDSSDHKFDIPTYQRPYSWRNKQIYELLQDFLKSYESGEEYFLGSIVATRAADGAHVPYQLIDGQQRLTSLLMLLAYLHHTAASPSDGRGGVAGAGGGGSSPPEGAGGAALAARFRRMLYLAEDPLEPEGSTGRYRLRLRDSDDAFFRSNVLDRFLPYTYHLTGLAAAAEGGAVAATDMSPAAAGTDPVPDSDVDVNGEGQEGGAATPLVSSPDISAAGAAATSLPLANETWWRLYDNATFLRKQLDERVAAGLNLQDFAFHVLRHCYVVLMVARDEGASFRIFSSLNGRGMDLTSVDKLKADLLAGDLTPSERLHFSSAWSEMESALGRSAFHSVFEHMRVLAAVQDPGVGRVPLLEYFTRRVHDPRAVKQILQVALDYGRLLLQLRSAAWTPPEVEALLAETPQQEGGKGDKGEEKEGLAAAAAAFSVSANGVLGIDSPQMVMGGEEKVEEAEVGLEVGSVAVAAAAGGAVLFRFGGEEEEEGVERVEEGVAVGAVVVGAEGGASVLSANEVPVLGLGAEAQQQQEEGEEGQEGVTPLAAAAATSLAVTTTAITTTPLPAVGLGYGSVTLEEQQQQQGVVEVVMGEVEMQPVEVAGGLEEVNLREHQQQGHEEEGALSTDLPTIAAFSVSAVAADPLPDDEVPPSPSHDIHHHQQPVVGPQQRQTALLAELDERSRYLNLFTDESWLPPLLEFFYQTDSLEHRVEFMKGAEALQLLLELRGDLPGRTARWGTVAAALLARPFSPSAVLGALQLTPEERREFRLRLDARNLYSSTDSRTLCHLLVRCEPPSVAASLSGLSGLLLEQVVPLTAPEGSAWRKTRITSRCDPTAPWPPAWFAPPPPTTESTPPHDTTSDVATNHQNDNTTNCHTDTALTTTALSTTTDPTATSSSSHNHHHEPQAADQPPPPTAQHPMHSLPLETPAAPSPEADSSLAAADETPIPTTPSSSSTPPPPAAAAAATSNVTPMYDIKYWYEVQRLHWQGRLGNLVLLPAATASTTTSGAADYEVKAALWRACGAGGRLPGFTAPLLTEAGRYGRFKFCYDECRQRHADMLERLTEVVDLE